MLLKIFPSSKTVKPLKINSDRFFKYLSYFLQTGIDVNASIFTAEEEIFAFERTVSRLSEMQTEQYWKTPGTRKKQEDLLD